MPPTTDPGRPTPPYAATHTNRPVSVTWPRACREPRLERDHRAGEERAQQRLRRLGVGHAEVDADGTDGQEHREDTRHHPVDPIGRHTTGEGGDGDQHTDPQGPPVRERRTEHHCSRCHTEHAFHGRQVTGQPFAEGEEHDADDERRGQPVLDPETDEAPDRDRDRDARLTRTPANADPDERPRRRRRRRGRPRTRRRRPRSRRRARAVASLKWRGPWTWTASDRRAPDDRRREPPLPPARAAARRARSRRGRHRHQRARTVGGRARGGGDPPPSLRVVDACDGPGRRRAGRPRALAHPAARAGGRPAHAQPETRAVRPRRRATGAGTGRRQHRPRPLRDRRRPDRPSGRGLLPRGVRLPVLRRGAGPEPRGPRAHAPMAPHPQRRAARQRHRSHPVRPRAVLDATTATPSGRRSASTTTPCSSATVGRLVAEKGLPELFDGDDATPRDRFVLVVVGAPDPVKPDALGADEVDACTRTRGPVPRSSRRRRRAVRGHGRLRAGVAPRRLPAGGDGGGGDGTSGRRHRRPRVPGGRRRRRHRIAGAGRRPRRAGGGAPGARGSRPPRRARRRRPHAEPGSTSTSAGSSRSCWTRTDASPARRASHSPVCEPESTTVADDRSSRHARGRPSTLRSTRSVVGPVTRSVAGHRCGRRPWSRGQTGGVWGQW